MIRTLVSLGILLVLAIIQYVDKEPTPEDITLEPDNNLYRVVRVVDGDTIVVEKDEIEYKVRLIGVDTPETVDPRKDTECFGIEASNYLKDLLDNKYVYLEGDETQSNKDRYERLLRYVYLEDLTLVNKIIIDKGYGFEYTYDLPYKYQGEFKEAQINAEQNKKGLWAEDACDKSNESM